MVENTFPISLPGAGLPAFEQDALPSKPTFATEYKGKPGTGLGELRVPETKPSESKSNIAAHLAGFHQTTDLNPTPDGNHTLTTGKVAIFVSMAGLSLVATACATATPEQVSQISTIAPPSEQLAQPLPIEQISPETGNYYPELFGELVYQHDSFRTGNRTIEVFNVSHERVLNIYALEHANDWVTEMAQNNTQLEYTDSDGSVHFVYLAARVDTEGLFYFVSTTSPRPNFGAFTSGHGSTITPINPNTGIKTVSFVGQQELPINFNELTEEEKLRVLGETLIEESKIIYTELCQATLDVTVSESGLNPDDAKEITCNSAGLMLLYAIYGIPYSEYHEQILDTKFVNPFTGEKHPALVFPEDLYNNAQSGAAPRTLPINQRR